MLKNKWVIFLLVVGVAVGTVVGVELSSEAWFCNICHSMKSEYETWEQSIHAENHVECKDCHYGPGLMGIVEAKIGGMFQLVAETTGSVTKHSPEDVHEKTGKLLLPQNIHTSTKGKEYAIKAHGKAIENANYRCRKCHDDIVTGQREQDKKLPNRVLINHKNHLEREVDGVKVDCTDCHQEIVHGYMPQRRNMPRMIICFECHNGETAFREDCQNCHTTQKNMHLGVGGVGVEEEIPGLMVDQDCVDCHYEENDYRFNEQVCVDCHEEESYIKDLREWQADTLPLLNKTKRYYDRVQGMLEKAGKMGKNLQEPKKLLRKAMYNIRFVDKDGTKGAHNFDYAQELLGVANEILRDAESKLE